MTKRSVAKAAPAKVAARKAPAPVRRVRKTLAALVTEQPPRGSVVLEPAMRLGLLTDLPDDGGKGPDPQGSVVVEGPAPDAPAPAPAPEPAPGKPSGIGKVIDTVTEKGWRRVIGWAGAALAVAIAVRIAMGLDVPSLEYLAAPLGTTLVAYVSRSFEKIRGAVG